MFPWRRKAALTPSGSGFDEKQSPASRGRLRAMGATILSILTPDFLGSSSRASAASGKPLGKTAYLDGLRGFAALMIYQQHNIDYAHPAQRDIIHHAFGWDGHMNFITFPFIRVFFHTGNLAVMLFFAISGYVTSVSLLKLVHSRDIAKVGQRIGVAIPQRFIRLWLPACMVSLTFMLCWHIFNIYPDGTHYPPANSFLAEIPRWIGNFFTKSYLFSKEAMRPNDIYDPHLWYIPLQMQASVLTYIILLCMAAFGKYPASARIWSMFALSIYFGYCVDSYFCALTTFGIMMADIDILSGNGTLPRPFSYNVGKYFWYLPLLAGLWLSTCPSYTHTREFANDPGWHWLTYLHPRASGNAPHWYNAWAGVLVLLAIPRIPWLRSFFELGILRDFGKITFSFYLVQGPLLWTIGDRLYAAVGRIRPRSPELIPFWVNLFALPEWGPLGLEVNYLAANLLLFPFMVWIASIATKVFEAPAGQFCTWLFNPERKWESKEESKDEAQESLLPMTEARQPLAPVAS